MKTKIKCLIFKTLKFSEENGVEWRRGEWLVLLSAWEGSAWVPERPGRGGRARGAVAGRAGGGEGEREGGGMRGQ